MNEWRWMGFVLLHRRSLAVLGVGLAALLAGLCSRPWIAREQQREAATQSDLRLRITAAANAQASTTQVPDFTQTLPLAMPMDKLVRTLQESARAANVDVVAVNGDRRPETAQSLGGLDVGITLRGPYPGLKSTLGDMLARYPDGVMRHLRIKRDAGGAGVEEATIQVLFPLRPSR
ncbi:MAG: hypothetical protein ABW032_08955 [Burkholderiaceae bacterium]